MSTKPTAEFIRRNHQKNRDEEQFYAWFVMRRVSAHITKHVVNTSITPNQISLFGIILGIVGGVCYGTASLAGAVVGSILIQLWYLSDCVDGEVARYKKQFSDEGIFLDAMGHHMVSFIAMVGFSIGLYREHREFWLIVACGLFITFYHFNKMIFTAAEQTIYGKFKGKEVKLQFPGDENNFYNQEGVPERPVIIKLFLWLLRLWPATGATINEIGILVAMLVTSFIDYFLLMPYLGENIYPDTRTMLVFFYAFMLPLSFLGRFTIVVSRSYVSNWINYRGK